MIVAITDELREYVIDADGMGMTHGHAKSIYAIADRIDREHRMAMEKVAAEADEDAMEEHGWIRLPLDADGVPIRVGDVMDVGIVFAIGDDGVFMVEKGFSGKYDVECFDGFACHHHAPTVEDVLREFALACEDAGNAGPEVERIAAEYAAKLRLVGDDE